MQALMTTRILILISVRSCKVKDEQENGPGNDDAAWMDGRTDGCMDEWDGCVGDGSGADAGVGEHGCVAVGGVFWLWPGGGGDARLGS